MDCVWKIDAREARISIDETVVSAGSVVDILAHDLTRVVNANRDGKASPIVVDCCVAEAITLDSVPANDVGIFDVLINNKRLAAPHLRRIS